MATYFDMLPMPKLFTPDFFQDIGQFSLLVIHKSFAISLSNTVLLINVGRFFQVIGELGQSSNLSACSHALGGAHVRFPLSYILDHDQILILGGFGGLDSQSRGL